MQNEWHLFLDAGLHEHADADLHTELYFDYGTPRHFQRSVTHVAGCDNMNLSSITESSLTRLLLTSVSVQYSVFLCICYAHHIRKEVISNLCHHSMTSSFTNHKDIPQKALLIVINGLAG